MKAHVGQLKGKILFNRSLRSRSNCLPTHALLSHAFISQAIMFFSCSVLAQDNTIMSNNYTGTIKQVCAINCGKIIYDLHPIWLYGSQIKTPQAHKMIDWAYFVHRATYTCTYCIVPRAYRLPKREKRVCNSVSEQNSNKG